MNLNEQKLFDEAIKAIEIQFGKGSISQLNNNAEGIEVIPTGSIQLDRALGVGGYPKGRVIEIYGNESCGKTTLALQAVAQCQKLNGKCAYIDMEHALDAKYSEANGVNLSKLLLAQPDSGEQAFSLIEALVKTGMIDLIVVDSVAALVPHAELVGEFGDATIGLQARMMSKGLRILQGLMAKYQTTIIFINQIRMKIGVMYGNPETTTGGRALKFYASVRIELRKAELIKNGDVVIGIRSSAKIVKNKVAPPLYKAFVDIYFDKGIDHTSEIVDFALEKGVIEKKGSWFYFEGNKIGQGKETTKEFLIKNADLFDKIQTKVLDENAVETVKPKKKTE
ncbi:MAG: recombinase RecA [Mycoplasmataceae bacterium]|jgi:recombination protein RecA|nr:recombinase RecA [Mycoplasmataceae bacterium]